ncbi:unnamed protein product [Camellia sinensis]
MTGARDFTVWGFGCSQKISNPPSVRQIGGFEKINPQPSARHHASVQNAADRFGSVGFGGSVYPLLTPNGKEGQAKPSNKKEEVNVETQPLPRLIIMGRKSLPDPSKKGRPYWGFVDMVTTTIEDVKNALKGGEYDTRTKGHRHNPPGRALGEGIYRILRHNTGKKTHTHLIYKLELPPAGDKNEPQESLNVEREGSFLIQIKNPDQQQQQHGDTSSQFGGTRSKRKAAVFPAHLQGRCEFLLISASDDIEEELGLDLKTECESEHCSDLVKTFGETVSTTPLLKGTWI